MARLSCTGPIYGERAAQKVARLLCRVDGVKKEGVWLPVASERERHE